jgi:hypothetical protein
MVLPLRLLFFPALLLIPVFTSRADYFDDTGYRALAAELGAALPDGTGVSVTQVEFGDPDYLPQAGSGSFAGTGSYLAGKTFTAKSGPSGASGHAFDVGAHFYSLNTNPQAGRASFAPGITSIDVYRVDPAGSSTSWIAQAWLEPGIFSAPLIENGAVQNHSWISPGSSSSAAQDNDSLRRFDFAIRRDGFLAVTGVNNGTSSVPALMASAYNNLAVGLSSGGHSTGGVASWLDGPGRQKPEIVAPLDFTSFSTALVSAAGALLRQSANSQGGNAVLPETLKAILLAGATKEEFPGWSRTPAEPLDPVFGAGELHVGHSWHILAGLQQPPNLTAPRPDRAWSVVTLTAGGTADYLLHLPAGSVGESLSVTAVWNRIINDTGPGSFFAMTVLPLADYQLRLTRVPATGPETLLDESISEDGNVEHLYQRNLRSGTYRLRLSLPSGSGAPAALAWRLAAVPHRPGIALTQAAGTDVLGFTGLLAGQSYLIQSSQDMSVWNPELAFTATGPGFSWISSNSGTRRFYRLAAVE